MAEYGFKPFVFTMNVTDHCNCVERRQRFQVDLDGGVCSLLGHRQCNDTATRSIGDKPGYVNRSLAERLADIR